MITVLKHCIHPHSLINSNLSILVTLINQLQSQLGSASPHSSTMPQLRSLRAAQRILTSLQSPTSRTNPQSLQFVFQQTPTSLIFSASFSSSAATASLSSSSPVSLASATAAAAPALPTSPQSAAKLDPSLSSNQPSGFYASLARLVAPLFLPFRRRLGLDNIATARYLTNAAIAASLADQHVAQYSLPPHPITGIAPLTILHMWLLHSHLIQHIQHATQPDSPTRPSLDRWQSIHRACLEYWWTHIADVTAPVVGGLMLNKTMITTQTHILGLFQALDLATAEADQQRRRQLLRSVLYRNLYGAGEEGGGGRKLEVMRLAEWVEVESQRLRVREGDGLGSERENPRLHVRQLPELKEEDRAEADRVVQLLNYEVKEGKLVVASAST